MLHGGRVEIEGSVKEVFSDERVVKPEAEMVAEELREKGLDLPFPMLTLEEIAEELLKRKRK